MALYALVKIGETLDMTGTESTKNLLTQDLNLGLLTSWSDIMPIKLQRKCSKTLCAGCKTKSHPTFSTAQYQGALILNV